MSIADKTGQTESITDVWRALRLFTNRQKLIKLFVSYLNEDPPPEKILFFYGDGGNGKSLLLQYLRENFCKRFKRKNWEWLKNTFHDEEFVAQIKATTENLLPTPVAAIDFGLKTTKDEFTQDSFGGLLMLRRQLAKNHIRFPLFDFACVWHLYKTDKISPQRLKDLFPAEEMDFVSGLVDVFSGTATGAIAKAIITVIGKHAKGDFSIWRQKRGLDESKIAEIQQMDANTDLIEHLPDFFAEDLNVAMQGSDASERVILFFDTHESFWGHQRTMPEATYFRQDEWLRRLLCKLEMIKGIVTVVAGRESPNSDSKGKSNRRWTDATRWNIPETFVDAHLVGHLSPADADVFLRRAGVTDGLLRNSLTKYAEVEDGEVHPLYLGLLVDIVLAAERQQKSLNAEDFHQQPETSLKGQELINRLLLYIDADTRNAVSALATCRSFDGEIFRHLGRNLNFHATDAAFEILLSFSFVWQAERRGKGWYRIHELLRRLFAINDKTDNKYAHRVLEGYYRQRNTDGDELAIAEAIYHRNRIDENHGVGEWIEVFETKLKFSRHQFCRALLEIRREMIIDDDFQLGYVSRLEGEFYRSLSYYTEAKDEIDEAIEAYDRVLELAPDNVPALANKGIALIRRGELEAGLARHEAAIQSYQGAIEACDRALELAPDNVLALANKGGALLRRGSLEAGLARHEAAIQSYQGAIEVCDRALELAPDYVLALANKGVALIARGELEAGLARHEAAIQSYQGAIEVCDRALELAPDNVLALANKGVALIARGELEAGLARHEAAIQSYQGAIEACDRALELAPDNVLALANKGGALIRRGFLEAGLARHEAAIQSYQGAIEACDRALELAPDNVLALANKGIALIRRGLRNQPEKRKEACQDWMAALAEFSRLLEIAPDDKNFQNKRQETENLLNEYCRET